MNIQQDPNFTHFFELYPCQKVRFGFKFYAETYLNGGRFSEIAINKSFDRDISRRITDFRRELVGFLRYLVCDFISFKALFFVREFIAFYLSQKKLIDNI